MEGGIGEGPAAGISKCREPISWGLPGNTIVKKIRNTPSITYGNKMFK
ncbi:hypothetical protein MaMV-DH010063 [Cyanophage MaMV-DH01]|nr:hypothetical protein MaMV-DH010063 [Cyanophage MaMV-DH01]